ncbi:Pr6Pr family membrane protein [Mucilaginibacter yixingensis]|nr:Pr6Pr family membrane protein [Mucilaginibacter yixingensis]
MPGAIIQIFSFFTIQTNLLVAVCLTGLSVLPKTSWGKFFYRPSVLTAIAVYISIVGLVYAVVLRNTWQPQGLFKTTDFLLHTISPLLYVVFWLVFVSAGSVKWQAMLRWAIFPLAYLVYALVRGAVIGWYPYPFLDVAKLGYERVAVNSLVILVVFLIFSALFIGGSCLRRRITA